MTTKGSAFFLSARCYTALKLIRTTIDYEYLDFAPQQSTRQTYCQFFYKDNEKINRRILHLKNY